MKAFALILTLALATCSTGTPDSPAAVVNAFFQARLQTPAAGAPTETQLQSLSPYLSDELQALLRQARELRDRQAAATPAEKPDFTDGDLFSSLFEGPTDFDVGEASPSGTGYRVPVRLRHRQGGIETGWTDTAIVVQRRGRWVIADIEYGGDWDFANRGALATTLQHTLAERQPWYGDWEVAGHRIPGIAAVTDGEAATHHGQTATYAAAQARFDRERCESPRYQPRTLTASALYEEYRLQPAQLGLTEPVTLIDVACATGQLGPGATLLIQSTDTLLTPWDGAFYELRRRPASR